MNTSRLEAFSDGVLAIIITIMVLELPRPEGHEWASLTRAWPTFLAYVLSFVFVGIYWNNHHHFLRTVRHVTGSLMWANLHLLFWLSLLPFVTNWAGETHFASIPMTVYAADAFMCALAFTLLGQVIIRTDPSNTLARERQDPGHKNTVSLFAYIVAVLAPFFGVAGVWVSGGCLMLVATLWLMPDRQIERVMNERGQARMAEQSEQT